MFYKENIQLGKAVYIKSLHSNSYALVKHKYNNSGNLMVLINNKRWRTVKNHNGLYITDDKKDYDIIIM